MNFKNIKRVLVLGSRLFWRERYASEVQTLFAALIIAVAATTTISHFGSRLNAGLQQQANELLGGDLVLDGTQPATQAHIQAGLDLGLTYSKTLELSTVVSTEEHLQLVSVKAIDDSYPLRGALRSKSSPEAAEQIGGRPEQGQIWIEARLLTILSVQVGDWLELGQQKLKIARVLTHEPDPADSFQRLMPRILMHSADLKQTGLIQPSSLVRYKDLWSGQTQALEQYQKQITPSLQANQRFERIQSSDNTRMGKTLQKAEQYLSLAGLVTVLLSGIAIALASVRFAKRHLNTSALLRCFGLSGQQTAWVYSVQIGILGIVGCCLGSGLGWIVQHLIFWAVQDVLPVNVPTSSLLPTLSAGLVGLTVLAGFAFPPIWLLKDTPPLRVLRKDLPPPSQQPWKVQLGACVALGAVLTQLSIDWRLTSILAGLTLATVVILGFGLMRGLFLLKSWSNTLPLHWRLGMGQLMRQPMMATGQTLAFGLILFAIGLVVILRTELINDWRSQLPDGAPNHFAINIQPDEHHSFIQAIQSIDAQDIHAYPISRGRLIQRNGADLKPKDPQGERALQRDLNLTWAMEPPKGNLVVQGEWWAEPNHTQGVDRVSVDQRLAESLGIQLHDRLVFDFSGSRVEAEVVNLRRVNWESLQPNFYFIFDPKSLQDVAHTFMLTFHSSAQEAALAQTLRDFPSVSLVQIDKLLKQLQDVVSQVSIAIEMVLMLVFFAGTSVLFAGLLATLDERTRQTAILRALGARSLLLQRSRLCEFGVLGLIAGLVAALCCELTTALLYHFVFRIEWQPHPWILLMPILGALLVTSVGLWATRNTVHSSPIDLLRDVPS